MKILYVVSRPLTINTSASIRNRATIMGLVEHGHEVELVTTQPDTNHMAYDGSMTLKDVKTTYIKLDGIQSVARLGRKLKFLAPLKSRVIGIMNSYNIYDNLKGIVDHISEIDISGYDVIISSSDPKSSHLFVEKAIKESVFKGRWIQIWGDPFYSDITLSVGSKKKEIFNEEKRLLSVCDRVVYVSELTLEAQKALYPEQAKKMIYIPIPYLKEIQEPIRDFGKINKIKIAYCGDYTSTVRNIIPLYNAVRELKDKAELVVCGNTDINIDTIENISVLGRQSYEKVGEIERDTDVLVHISNLHGNQIPGKIYQYSGTNKPILFVLDGDKGSIKKQFKKYDRYIFADNCKESIKASIENIIIENKSYKPVLEFSKNIVTNAIIA